jgi:hypothetical protein
MSIPVHITLTIPEERRPEEVDSVARLARRPRMAG